MNPLSPDLSTTEHDAMLDTVETAALLRVSVSTLRGWRFGGTAPASFKVGGSVRWMRSEIDRWLDEQRQTAQQNATQE